MTNNEIIVVINPGSTSTKMAIYKGVTQIADDVVRHDAETLSKFHTIWEQFDFRLEAVKAWMKTQGVIPAAVVGMGGLLKPLTCGTYRVDEAMLADARANLQGEHASNLGCAIAYEIAREYHCPSFVVDPISVDEFEPLARYSGHPLIQRNPLAHALNLHAVARRAAQELKRDLQDSSFVVVHMGGGISVVALKNNRMIDVNDASSDGPFSPERTGGLPLQQFISLCFSGKYTEPDMRKFIMGKGGLLAYLGTNSAKDVEDRMAAGDKKAHEVFEAMAYQIAKEIGAMATVLRGNVDALVLTGGLASSKILVEWITDRVRFIRPVLVYPGEDEMQAMALGALRVIRGEEEAKKY